MKNSILNIALAFAGVAALSSCSDFLDKAPKEELSDASFWKSSTDAEMYISDMYNSLGWSADEAINTDDATMGIKWAAGNESKGVYDPSDYGWKSSYTYIREANLALEKLPTVEMDDATRQKLEGQAYFFRGYLYWDLIRSFGSVPYIDKPLTLSDLNNTEQSSREDVYAKAMADLDKAIASLPEEWDAANYGRITKGAARAIKMRAAMYYGDNQTAANEAKAIMDAGVYDLWDKDNTGKYAHLFWGETDGCCENILVIQYKAAENGNYLIGWECFPTLGWGGMDPTQDLVDAFEDKDGSPIYESSAAGVVARDNNGNPTARQLSQIFDPANPFANRDPRLEVNVLHDGEVMYGTTIKVAPLASSGNTGIGRHGDATETGYYQQKWLDPAIDPASTGWDMGKDYVLIRYAEVLLTYAEAMNNLNPLCQEAFDAVNKVRARVGMPALQKTDASKPTYCGTQADLLKRIKNEWRVEFALEGDIRKWNLRRWGDAKEVLNRKYHSMVWTLNGENFTPYVGTEHVELPGSKYSDHNYIYPIPQTEMDLNPKLKQNPGYGKK